MVPVGEDAFDEDEVLLVPPGAGVGAGVTGASVGAGVTGVGQQVTSPPQHELGTSIEQTLLHLPSQQLPHWQPLTPSLRLRNRSFSKGVNEAENGV
jgi:hypothetical protein